MLDRSVFKADKKVVMAANYNNHDYPFRVYLEMQLLLACITSGLLWMNTTH